MESTNNQNVRSENDQPLGTSITTGPNSSSSVRVAVPEPTDTKPFNPNSVSSTPLPNYPNVENSVGIDFSRDYDFKQVKDLLPTLDENAFKQIDPDYMAYLGAVENELNKYIPPVVSNVNTRLPGNATRNYNPVGQALPTRSSSSYKQPSSFGSRLHAAMGRVRETPSSNKSLIGHVSPTYFSAKAAAFDRYYKHPKFNELSFHPYVNNEAYYNANSTIMDDGVRMIGQAANQFGSAAKTCLK